MLHRRYALRNVYIYASLLPVYCLPQRSYLDGRVQVLAQLSRTLADGVEHVLDLGRREGGVQLRAHVPPGLPRE